MNRRKFLHISAAGLSLLLTAGCGGDGADLTVSQGPQPGGATLPPTGVGGSVPSPLLTASEVVSGGALNATAGGASLVLDNQVITAKDPEGRLLWSTAREESRFNGISGACSDGTRIWLSDIGNGQVHAYSTEGDHLLSFSLPQPDSRPAGLAVSASRNLLAVCDSALHQIHLYTLDGRHSHSFGSLGTDGASLNGPRAVAFDSKGRLHVADAGNVRVSAYTASGDYQGSYGGESAGAGQLLSVRSLLIDRSDRVYVADPLGSQVAIYSPEGVYLDRIRAEDPTRFQPFGLQLAQDGGLLISVY